MVVTLFKIWHNKGFIAILSLLIITTISMIIAITLLKDGVDNAALSLSSIYYENAKLNSIICLEDSLIRIKKEEQFNQNLDYTIGAGQSCSSTIQWYPTQQTGTGRWEALVDLEVGGGSSNFTRTFDYQLKVKKITVNNTDGTIEYVNEIDIISIEEISG
ncbi:hypothetical protein KJ657_01275 [Patescibacteria group bacterium]|nr:hypothetical protein [Patescibacteria group bacterium]